MDNKNIFINKFIYNVICLLGIICLVFTGIFFGYTYKENEKYFESREILYVKYINEKYTYHNVIYTNDKNYSEIISRKIFNISLFMSIISLILIEYGYRNTFKYEYSTSLKQRLKDFYARQKENDI